MFELVNPTIVGIFKIEYDEETPIAAAKRYWNELSKYVVNELPQSFFTLRGDDGKLYHFKATEQKGKTSANSVDYMITQLDSPDVQKDKRVSETFDKIMSRAQKGGRRHRYKDDDSSSSSSSSSSSDEDDDDELVKRFNKKRRATRKQPIMYYHYIPSVYDDDSVFIPTFVTPYIPQYIELGFSTAFWG